MGFLDAFGSNDPQSEAMRQGLLRMGLALMQAKGNPGQILGQAGTEGVNGMQSFQDRQFKQKLQQEALAEIARKKVIQGREDTAFTDAQRLAALPSKFYTPAQPGGFDATGGIETSTTAPNNMIPGRMDQQGLMNALYGSGIPGSFQEGLKLEGQLRKDAPTIHSLGVGGGSYWDQQSGTMKIIPPAGGSQHAPPAEMQIAEQLYGKGTPEYNKALATHLERKDNPAPTGMFRNAAGNLTWDPKYLEGQMQLRAVGPTINVGGGQPLVNKGNASLTGEEFLKTLSPQQAIEVKAVAEGKQPVSNTSVRGGARAALVAAVQQYKPDFYQPTYKTQADVQKDFTSGPTSKNITAINTTIAHMGTMLKAADALDNGNIPLANQAMNTVLTAFGKPQVNNFEIAKQAVGNELMRVFRQVQASEQETQAWESRFKSANSPQQIREAIGMGVELLKGRIDSVDDQWKRGMNTDQGYPNLLSPKSKAVVDATKVIIGKNDIRNQADEILKR